MKSFYFPIALTIGGGILYHFAQKSVPKAANPFFVLMVAYLVGFAVCGVLMIYYSSAKSLPTLIKELNWTVFAIGLGAAAIEVGFLLAYRVGWNISLAAISTSIAVTIFLILIGIIAFKESLSIWNMIGILFCLLGLLLVSQK